MQQQHSSDTVSPSATPELSALYGNLTFTTAFTKGRHWSLSLKRLTLRQLMLYIYIYIYDISSLRVNQLLYCVSLKMYNKFAKYFCELKFSGNTHQRP